MRNINIAKNNFIKAIENKESYIEGITDLERNIGKTQLLVDISKNIKYL